MSFRLILAGSLLFAIATSIDARVIYVDNQNGWDGYDGFTADPTSQTTGPVQTIERALRLARQGDTIDLRNTGTPYRESIALSGINHSGYPQEPFVIQGNGAVLNGLAAIPSDGWRRVGEGLWRLSLTRKGHYRFFRGDQPVAEHRPTTGRVVLDELPVEHWVADRGAVIFRLPPDSTPQTESWSYAALEYGVSLVDVKHVELRGLTIQGCRVDGLALDNNCRAIRLDDVTLEQHGRCGLAINGTSHVTVTNSRIRENGRHAILITERAGVELVETDLDGAEPTLETSR